MFECTPVVGRDTVLQNEINVQMADNLDGTYTYSYSTDSAGEITMYVLLYTQFGVFAEFFNNINYSGTVDISRVYPLMDHDFSNGLVTTTQIQDVSSNIYFKLRSPVSLNVTFIWVSNQYGYFYFNGDLRASPRYNYNRTFDEVLDK